MIYIGLDDTDNLDSRGTGYLARQVAAYLGEDHAVLGVSRHQLLDDPRVPMTAKNSCAAIHISEHGAGSGDGQTDRCIERFELESLGEIVCRMVSERSAEGSDPGVCVGRAVPEAISRFGRSAQTEIVCQTDARSLAAAHGLFLRGLGGTEDGVIGALSAVGLASTGNDGRFIIVGALRDLAGKLPIQAALDAGIACVCTRDGTPVTEGLIDMDLKPRPAMRAGRPVLYVEPGEGAWRPIRMDEERHA